MSGPLASLVKIKLVPVVSSTLKSVGYDKPSRTLHVEFKSGGVYELTGVPAKRHILFMEAGSKGEYYAQVLKPLTLGAPPIYPCRRIDPGTPGVAVQASLKRVTGRKTPTQTELKSGTPLYLCLLKAKKLMGTQYASLPFLLWTACGKEPTKNKSLDSRYARCLKLIAEASGCNTIGGQYLDPAIQLAKDRGV